MFATFSYLLTCVRPIRITLKSPSIGTSWSTRLLQGTSRPMRSSAIWTSGESVLLIIVVFLLRLLLLNRAFFTFHPLFPVTSLISQTAWKVVLLMFSHAGYLPRKPPSLPSRPLWIFKNYGIPGSLNIQVTPWFKIINTNLKSQSAWGLLLVSNTSKNGTALHAPLAEFRFFPPAGQFHLPAAFDVLPVKTLHYFSEVSWDRVSCPGGLTRRHRFRKAAQMEMALRFMEGLVLELAARERVPLLDEPILATLLSFDWLLM